MINKDASTITIEKGSLRREVVYSGDTKFMYGHSNNNKPGAADQVTGPVQSHLGRGAQLNSWFAGNLLIADERPLRRL